MRKIKKILAIILTLSMLIGCTAAVSFVSFASVTRIADVNGDGKINAKDSLILRRYIAGVSNDIIEDAADINGDSYITLADSLLLRKHLSRVINIDILPVTDCYLASVTVFGVELSRYQIVIPAEHDVYTQYAAELLQDYVKDKSGIVMPVVNDTDSISNYEFLIGNTNRPESINAKDAASLAENEYLLKADGFKIVMLGDSYMIAGGVGEFTYDYITYDPEKKAQVCNISDLPTDNTPSQYTAREAKNCILLIGDGMGAAHPEGSLFYNNAKQCEPEYTEFSAFRLPAYCLCTTASITTLISGGTTPTDSGAAGTALACAQKTTNDRVGQSASGNDMRNIREVAVSLGKRNGVMTTEPITGATPACFTVHNSSRKNIDEIAAAQNALTDIDYLKGDLLDELLPETIYELDLLSTNNEAGFFTMIEEAKIDTYSHSNDPKEMIHAMARFNSCIQYCMTFAVAHPDTLLIVTADHETGSLNSKCQFLSQTHTTADVAVYAIGHGSEAFSGTIDNTLIPKTIANEWGVKMP